MFRLAPLLSILLLHPIAVLPSPAPRHSLSSSQAEHLALAALNAQQKRLPGLEAEQFMDPNSSRFLFFTIYWAAGEKQSVVVDNFAVDPYTGDVWSSVASCLEESNPSLRALQIRMRHFLGLSRAEYRQIKSKGPLCDE